jgi:Fe-S-cluster containining protein
MSEHLYAKVECGSCRICCHNEIIMLVDGDDPTDYDTHELAFPNSVTGAPITFALKHRPDGACIYLGDDGCTIYDRRPRICRVFTCVGWVETILSRTTRAERRRNFATGKLDRATFDAGLARLKDAQHE